jgi:hypothetical protein
MTKPARNKLTLRVQAAAKSIPGTTCYGHGGTEILFSKTAALICHQGVDGQTVGDIADNVDTLLGAGAFAKLLPTGTFMVRDETTLDEPSQMYSLSVDPVLLAELDAARVVAAGPLAETSVAPATAIERMEDAVVDMPILTLAEGTVQMVDIDAPRFEGAEVEADGTVLVTDVRLTYAGEERYEALALAVPADAVASLAEDGIAYGMIRREGDRYVLLCTETWKPTAAPAPEHTFVEDKVFSQGCEDETAFDAAKEPMVVEGPKGDQVRIDLSAGEVVFTTTRLGDACAKIVMPGQRTTMAFGTVAEALRGKDSATCIVTAGRSTDKIVAVYGDNDEKIFELPRAA